LNPIMKSSPIGTVLLTKCADLELCQDDPYSFRNSPLFKSRTGHLLWNRHFFHFYSSSWKSL